MQAKECMDVSTGNEFPEQAKEMLKILLVHIEQMEEDDNKLAFVEYIIKIFEEIKEKELLYKKYRKEVGITIFAPAVYKRHLN